MKKKLITKLRQLEGELWDCHHQLRGTNNVAYLWEATQVASAAYLVQKTYLDLEKEE